MNLSLAAETSRSLTAPSRSGPGTPSRPLFAAIVIGLAAGVAYGLVELARLIKVLLSPGIEQRDFTAFYYLAGSIRHGIDPNVPLPQIGVALGLPGLTIFNHPTPHPPTAGILLLPLAWLPYNTASLLWLALGVAALALGVALLARLAGIGLPAWLILPVSLAALLWMPISEDLGWGNVNSIMLALLAGMLVALSTNRRSVAGVLLAVCLLLKPIAWPVLLLLVLRRDWKTAGSCLLGGGVVALVTTAVVGPLRFVDYFLHSLPLATDYYRLDAFNISLMSLATRLFVGAEYPPGPTATLHFLPLVYSPLAGTVLQGVVAVSVLAAGLLATRHMPLQPALVCMLIVSLLITPTAWDHYLVLTLLPVAFLIAALRRRGWPRHLTRASAVLLALIALPAPLWEQVLNIRLIQPTVQATGSYWPIASAALALMPAYILIALAALGIFVEWGAAGVPSPTISEKRALLVPQRAVPVLVGRLD